MSAKRAVIEQKFKKMEAEAKRLGVTLLTKPEAFIDDDHLDIPCDTLRRKDSPFTASETGQVLERSSFGSFFSRKRN